MAEEPTEEQNELVRNEQHLSSYRGFDIRITRYGEFIATLAEDLEVRELTLKNAKTRIDEHCARLVPKRTISLPVVVISRDRKHYTENSTPSEVREVRLIGINRTTRELQFDRKPGKEREFGDMLPACDYSREILTRKAALQNDLIEVNRALHEIVESNEQVILGYGKLTHEKYEEKLALIEASHARVLERIKQAEEREEQCVCEGLGYLHMHEADGGDDTTYIERCDDCLAFRANDNNVVKFETDADAVEAHAKANCCSAGARKEGSANADDADNEDE